MEGIEVYKSGRRATGYGVNVSRGGNQEVRLSAGGARVQGMASLIAKFPGGGSARWSGRRRDDSQGKAKQGIDKVRHWIMASWATSETLRAISGLSCRALSVVPLGAAVQWVQLLGAPSGNPRQRPGGWLGLGARRLDRWAMLRCCDGRRATTGQ